jgi:mannitol-1-phosphate/altronate dehydrogenase
MNLVTTRFLDPQGVRHKHTSQCREGIRKVRARIRKSTNPNLHFSQDLLRNQPQVGTGEQ